MKYCMKSTYLLVPKRWERMGKSSSWVTWYTLRPFNSKFNRRNKGISPHFKGNTPEYKGKFTQKSHLLCHIFFLVWIKRTLFMKTMAFTAHYCTSCHTAIIWCKILGDTPINISNIFTQLTQWYFNCLIYWTTYIYCLILMLRGRDSQQRKFQTKQLKTIKQILFCT